MEVSGSAAWSGNGNNTGEISIPFKSRPTFESVRRTPANASVPFNPTRATFGSSDGRTLVFDWSDSRSLNPSYDNSTNSIDYQVGGSFSIDPVVTAARVGSSIATKTDYEGFPCYASGRYWVFFNDGAAEGYVSSTDAASWTKETPIPKTGGSPGLFAFYCTGNSIYYIAASSSSSTGVVYSTGTFTPGGVITFQPEGTFYATGFSIRGLSTVVDSNGVWWAAFGGFISTGEVEVWRCTTPSSCYWAQSSSFSAPYGGYVPYADVVPLTGGKMAVTWTNGPNTMGDLGIRTFDGSTWSGIAYAPGGPYRMDASACVSIGDTVHCGVDSSDAAVGYVSASYNGNSPAWGSFFSVDPCGSTTSCYASMSTDGKSDLILTFVDSTSAGYAESFDSGALWSPIILFPTNNEQSPVYVSSPYSLGSFVMATWTEKGTCSHMPCLMYNVRLGTSLVQFPPTATPPWAQQGLSPYESYVNNAAVYVSMGNGLLSIEQPTFTLPGRGLSVAPALFYSEPGAFQFGGKTTAKVDNFTLANLGPGWSLNLPWLGTYAVHLPNGEQYPYSWNGGTNMKVHGPVDFELNSTGAGGVCPCTLTLPSGVQFFFNAAKQLTSEADPTGHNVVSFSYGSNGMLSSIKDAVGRIVAFSYSAGRQLVAITAPGNRVWSLAYTGPRLTSVTDPVHRVTGFRYNLTIASGLLIDEVDYRTEGAKVRLTYLTGDIAGGITYVANSRNVYSAAGSISQSNHMSYSFANGSLLADTMESGGGDGIAQGFITKVYQPSKGIESTYFADQFQNTFRITENDYTGNRLTAMKIEAPSGNLLAESDASYDSWGNVVYTKDNVGQQAWLSYANTDSAGIFGSLECNTNGFYSNLVPLTVHDRLIGSCTFQNGAGSAQQEGFYNYAADGGLLETKVSHDGGWLYTDYARDVFGNVLSVKDANGTVVSYAYSPAYGSAYLTKASRTAGSQVISTSYAYDFATGFPTSVTSPNFQTTSYSYDPVGRILSVTYPFVNGADSVVTYSYDDVNGIVTGTDPNGNVVNKYFDGLGRETRLQVLDNQQNVYSTTVYNYDWEDKVSRIILPSRVSSYNYTYDSVGRPLSQTNPDKTVAAISYNDVANSVTARDANGSVTTTTYDWNGRVISVLRYASPNTPALTSYTYDLSGNPNSAQNTDGQVTSYSYDDLNRLTRIVGPDGNSTSYAYDKVGDIVSKTTANGATITYRYDSAYRLTTVAYPRGATTKYTYDPDGNVRSVTSTLSGATQDAFTYDAMDRLTSATLTVAGKSYTTLYHYDPASNLDSITYPDGMVLAMSYDFENRLNSTGPFATFSYNVDNTIASIKFGDGEVQHYTYDKRDRVKSIVDTIQKLVPLNLTYAYDKASNVIGINGQKFKYDGMNRLTSATGGWGTTTYAYDGAGDMLASTSGGVTTGYVGCGFYSNNLPANALITCATDKDGNIVSKASGGGRWTYSYDVESEMTAASFNGVVRQTNVYDGLGNRVETTGASSTVFAYQGVNLLYERNLTSGTRVDHVYGDGMQLAKVVAGSTVYYYHQDLLGSTRSTTYVPNKAAVSFSSDYQPYGQSYGASGSEPFQFTDRMHDASTGLYYDNARFYDPTIMRFMQKDPVGLGGMSAYMYANDNPLAYTDPTGLQALSPLCPVVCGHAPQMYGQAYGLWRETGLRQSRAADACINSGYTDATACRKAEQDMAWEATGLVGGTIDEAVPFIKVLVKGGEFRIGSEAEALAIARQGGYLGSEIPAVTSSLELRSSFEDSLVAGLLKREGVAYVKQPELTIAGLPTHADLGVGTGGTFIVEAKAFAGPFPGRLFAEEKEQFFRYIGWINSGEGRRLSYVFINFRTSGPAEINPAFQNLMRLYDVPIGRITISWGA
jgi:RHS repeat-associated protein